MYLLNKIKKIIFAFIHPIYFFESRKRESKRIDYKKKQSKSQTIDFNLTPNLTIKLKPAGQIAEMLYIDKFESDIIERVSKFIKPGMNIIDAGANIGLYSIIAGKIMNNTGHVWAFEPGIDTVEKLITNISLNKLNCIDVVHKALSNKDNQLINLVSTDSQLDAERYLINEKNNEELQTINIGLVETITLDKYFSRMKNLKIDFIKMDIEGSEVDALKGAKNILKNNNDLVVMFENTPICLKKFGYTQNDLYKLFRDLNFMLYAWDKRRNQWLSNENIILKTGNLWACRDVKLLPL